MTKYIIKLIAIPLFILFIGCGSGDDSTFKNTESSSNSSVATCTDTVSDWTTVSSGDVVVGSSGATLKFDHDSDNVKRVCVSTGSAYIISA